MKRRLAHIASLAVVASTFVVVSGPGTPIVADPSQACDQPTRRTTLYAVELPRDPDGRPRIGWGRSPETASIPGPLLEMFEGECMAITVVNDVPEATLAEIRDTPGVGSQDPDMPLGVSLHVHGVKYTQASDGTLQTDSWVPSGRARTYYWYAAPRVSVAGRIVSQGTAGYWWYHDHVVGTDHGTGGLASGLFGGLVVRRPGDLLPDRTFTVAFGSPANINLRRWPETDCNGDESPTLDMSSDTCLVAEEGERVEFLVIGMGDEFHTFHLHGHNWANNRTGILQTQADEVALIDNRTIGPADSFGFQIIAGQEVGDGAWMMHCHVQIHSDVGMFSFFRVLSKSGIPLPANQVPLPHRHFGREG